MTIQDHREYLRANRALWDEWTTIHERSDDYDVAGFKVGGSRMTYPFLVAQDDGTWRLPEGHAATIPLFFSLKAIKLPR